MATVHVKYDYESDMIDVYPLDVINLSDEIKDGLRNMSVYYNELKFVGYIYNNVFSIHEVEDTETGRKLTSDEIIDMWYEGLSPEHIEINEPF